MLKNKHGYFVDEAGNLIHRKVCREAHGSFNGLWHVHHIDGQKLNNDPSNLIALHPAVHWEVHSRGIVTREGCVDLLNRFLELEGEKRRIESQLRREFGTWSPRQMRVEGKKAAKRRKKKAKSKKKRKAAKERFEAQVRLIKRAKPKLVGRD